MERDHVLQHIRDDVLMRVGARRARHVAAFVRCKGGLGSPLAMATREVCNGVRAHSDPDREREFLHCLPGELMWGVGPVTKARLAENGVLTIGELAKTPGWSLERLLGRAAGEKLAALAWNRDPREIKTSRRARSAGAQSAIGRKPAGDRVFDPSCFTLRSELAPGSGPSPGLAEP